MFSSTSELRCLKEHLSMLMERFYINHVKTLFLRWPARMPRMRSLVVAYSILMMRNMPNLSTCLMRRLRIILP